MLIKKMIFCTTYVDAIIKEEKVQSLELYIEKKFKVWGFDYKVEFKPYGNSGYIHMFNQDKKRVGTFKVDSFTCNEVDVDLKEVSQYWERDVRNIYYEFMNQNFKTWKRDFKKQVNQERKDKINMINSL